MQTSAQRASAEGQKAMERQAIEKMLSMDRDLLQVSEGNNILTEQMSLIYLKYARFERISLYIY